MDISSDSSDTIILIPNNEDEPSDSEIESILKKYSSTSSSVEESTSSKNNLNSEQKFFEESSDKSFNQKLQKQHSNKKSANENDDFSCDKDKYNLKSYGDDYPDNGELSDEDLIDIPLIKRLKTTDDESSVKKLTNRYDCKSDQISKYSLDDYLNDSDDSVNSVAKIKNIIVGNLDVDSEDISKELYNKYLTSASNTGNQKTNLVLLSDDSDNVNEDKSNSSEDEHERDLDMLSPEAAAKVRKQRELDKKRKDRAREKEKKRDEAEQKKAMRNLEKERKKEMMEKQKAMKNALKTVEQSTRPDECIKHMIVELPLEICQKDYEKVLKTTLNNNGISFKSSSQALPNLVSWCRKIQTLDNMLLKNTEVNEKHFLLIMDKAEFSKHIRNNSLTIHIQGLSDLIRYRQLTIAVLGVDKAKGDQDLAVTEAQMFTKCYFRFVKDSEDLALLVIDVTKAIAQIPYKLKKEEKYKLQTEYFNDSNKDTVRVDKNGNGLGRLWHQMLTMFPLARLETAEAITAAYPTPVSLFKAYDSCEKKEALLQDLPIRRALGPCVSVRKIGPELSRKCSNFFCSTENILL